MTDRLSPSQELLRYFAYRHLPAPLQHLSRECAELADYMQQFLPDGPEKTMGLRKLLEAKDCFVRAALPPAPAYPLIEKSDGLRCSQCGAPKGGDHRDDCLYFKGNPNTYKGD